MELTLSEQQQIVSTYLETNNELETARLTRHSLTTISKYLNKYGFAKGRGGNQDSQRKVTDEQIVEACKTMTRHDAADYLGIHVTNFDKRMHKLGIHAVKEKPNTRVKNKIVGWHYIKSQADLYEKAQPNYEYVGYLNKHVRMRCKTCGTIVERTTSTARYKKISCDVCSQKKQLYEQLFKTLSAVAEMKTPKKCKSCGEIFYSKYSDALYCSKKCKKTTSYKRRCKKYGVFFDRSVTRKAVIKRDGNICQICGKVCNENDKRWGTLGPDFPTVDHIVPLAVGGEHTWENVQCVCAICNSYKRDLSPKALNMGVVSWI